jgi:hypothetical protein
MFSTAQLSNRKLRLELFVRVSKFKKEAYWFIPKDRGKLRK